MTFPVSARHRLVRLAAYGAIYFIWGGTYLASRIAVETIPPFLMAAARFTIAGAILATTSGWHNTMALERPACWRSAAPPAVLLIVVSYALQSWALQYVTSTIAAAFAATVPFWLLGVDWAVEGRPPKLIGVVGLILGATAVLMIAQPSQNGHQQLAFLPLVALLISELAWVGGTIATERDAVSTEESSATKMARTTLLGGVILATISPALGELNGFQASAVSARSAFALLYLIIGGSAIGFVAYSWLLRHEPSAKVATFALVNPAVAAGLGVAFDGDVADRRFMASIAMLLLGLVLVPADRPSSAKPSSQVPDAG